ncbi:hypothetical protein RclHR1_09740005 [Rhizophagus clarus]|uniref:Galactose oxidase n=1 Tax=Rhizophagus clarus TaxID=94130 RepID=A0A2Z6SI92_9GLOM|nr:hypothetical protein RclHR1_09740005 [Rhizophagus clarus]
MSILLIQFFLWVTVINGQFIPGPRSGHTANFVNDKVYFIGGYNFSIAPLTSDIFYYGGSGNQVTWVDLNGLVGVDIPFKFGHVAAVGGPNQDLLFVIGGLNTNLVYQLDTKIDKISAPITLGNILEANRLFMSSASYGGKIYLFGGNDLNNMNMLYNNLYIFDTINLNWQAGSLINAPPPTTKLTSTMVNGVIYYIGGILQNDVHQSMTNIFQYDTVSNTWSLKVATLALGGVPGPRFGHTAVLVDAKICIFGGIYLNFQSPEEPIAMLDTITLEWSIPQFYNPKMPNLPNLVYHTATLIDKYMLVAFGNDTNVPVKYGVNGLNNNFYIFDFNKFQWTSETAIDFVKTTPNTNPTSNPSNTNPNPNPNPILPITTKVTSTISSTTSPTSPPNQDQITNKPVIVGLSVGIVLVGSAAVGALILVFYKRRNQKGELGHSDVPNGEIPSNRQSTLYPNQQYAPTPQYQPTNHQQFIPPQQQRISNYHNLTQPQRYSGQENTILPIPSDGDRFSERSSNYHPGSETYPYSHGSESYPYSQGSETPPPPPPKFP